MLQDIVEKDEHLMPLVRRIVTFCEFGDLADRTDDDNTAIGHLTTVKSHLSDLSGFLTLRKRMRRSVEGKTNISSVIYIVTKTKQYPYRL